MAQGARAPLRAHGTHRSARRGRGAGTGVKGTRTRVATRLPGRYSIAPEMAQASQMMWRGMAQMSGKAVSAGFMRVQADLTDEQRVR